MSTAIKVKSIIIVGYSHADEGAWLDAECRFQIANGGREFKPTISLSYIASYFNPPPDKPAAFRWDMRLLNQKVEDLRSTTKLQVLKKYKYRDEWMAVFGRLETQLPRRIKASGQTFSFIAGFGHLSGSPAQLVGPGDGYQRIKAKKGDYVYSPMM